MLNYEIKQFATLDTKFEIINFIKKHHYLKSISRGNKACFILYEGKEIIGAALFGHPVGRLITKNYGKNIFELKRFVMLNGKNNGCSWFLGSCLRILKKQKLCDRVITYADPEKGHEGIIYKATNFKYVGKQQFGTPYVIFPKIGKIYARNVYDTNSKKGIYYRDLKKSLGLKVKYAKPKHIFMYNFI